MNIFELGIGDVQKKEVSEKEKKLQEAILKIQDRYGKNSILKAANLQEGSTVRERNEQIGGHHA